MDNIPFQFRLPFEFSTVLKKMVGKMIYSSSSLLDNDVTNQARYFIKNVTIAKLIICLLTAKTILKWLFASKTLIFIIILLPGPNILNTLTKLEEKQLDNK